MVSAASLTLVTLWQRPRPATAPADFAVRVRHLHDTMREIGGRFERAALASSLSVEDMVLAHAIAHVGARIDVFAIDTGRLHAETVRLIDARTHVVKPDAADVAAYVAKHGPNGFYDSVSARHACCQLRKVAPLAQALAGRDAWLTGQRRAHGPERALLRERETDTARGMAKFNPLAAWRDDDVWFYADTFELPVNPLYARGYASIGCEPCTRAIRADEDPRAGRWWWEQSSSKECGLHVATES